MADVQHNQLTGSDLHEPKGIAGQASNKVYVSNGANSGVWTTIVPPSRTLISTQTASNSATLDFTGLTGYNHYSFEVQNLVPASDSDLLIRAQISAAFQSTSYTTIYTNNGGSGSNTTGVYPGVNGTVLVDNVAASSGVSGTVDVYNIANTAGKKLIMFNLVWGTAPTTIYQSTGTGFYTASNAALTGIRFLMTTGNITSGAVRLYGNT